MGGPVSPILDGQLSGPPGPHVGGKKFGGPQLLFMLFGSWLGKGGGPPPLLGPMLIQGPGVLDPDPTLGLGTKLCGPEPGPQGTKEGLGPLPPIPPGVGGPLGVLGPPVNIVLPMGGGGVPAAVAGDIDAVSPWYICSFQNFTILCTTLQRKPKL